MSEKDLQTNDDNASSIDMEAALTNISEGLGFDRSPDQPNDGSSDDPGSASPDPSDPSVSSAIKAEPLAIDTKPEDGTVPLSVVDDGPPPPKTWRAEALAEWKTLSPTIKAEVQKREDDMFRGIEAYKGDAEAGKAFKSVMDPYIPLLREHNINPVSQVKALMDAHTTLATGTPDAKIAMFQHLAQSYGVPLGNLQDAPYVDPGILALQNEISMLKSTLNQQTTVKAEEAQATLRATVDAFASDPKNVHFEEVAADVATMIRSGVASTLQEAYEKAVWANPMTRAKEQTRLQAEAVALAKSEAAEKVRIAKAATAANLKVSSRSVSARGPLGSMDDTLAETLAQINART